MIHINLLPVKASRKQEASRQQLYLLAIVLLAGIGLNYWGYSKRAAVAGDLQRQVTQTQQEIAQLDKVIGEVKDITQRKEDLKKKLDVLDSLKRGRSGPVKVLDAVQTALPKKVWLTDMGSAGGAMTIQGVAISHDDLAEFMRALQNVVDTPQGIGKLVEGGDGKVSRVESSDTGQVVEFPVADVHQFFTNVELQKAAEQDQSGIRVVNFGLSCSANYSA